MMLYLQSPKLAASGMCFTDHGEGAVRYRVRDRHAAWAKYHLAIRANEWAVKELERRFNTDMSDWLTHAATTVAALGALRTLCRNKGVEQYRHDVEAMCSNSTPCEEIYSLLDANGFFTAEISDWLNTAHEDFGYVVCGNTLVHEDDTIFCECYGETRLSEGSQSVVSRNWSDQEWCENAVEDKAFYCDFSNRYYDTRYFTAGTCNEETICEQWAQDHDYYQHGDGDWYNELEDDEDEDEDEEGFGVPDYHGANRNWDYDVARRSLRPFYGFELEVDFRDSEDRREFWNAHLRNNVSFCGEMDGSLDEESGFEIISRPIALDELREPNNLLAEMCELLYKARARDGGDGYGVHITANWNRFSAPHQRRIRDAIVDKRLLSEFIARRKGTEYCEYKKDNDKHDAVAPRRDGSCEFRIFRSTVSFDMLMSYVEYLEAVFEWTRDPTRSYSDPMDAAMFRIWVCAHRNTYPHLAARFPQPTTKESNQCASPSSSLLAA